MTKVLGPRMRRDRRAQALAPNTRSRCARCGAFDHNRRTCTRWLPPDRLLAWLTVSGVIREGSTL